MKSKTKAIELIDFRGGLNFTVPPENLEPNELYFARNVEYDALTGTLKRRPGLVRKIDTGVNLDIIHYSKSLNRFLISSGQNFYEWNGIDPILINIGTLSGAEKPKFVEFNGKVLIASGGHIQSYDGITFSTITSSPQADGISKKNGRVVVWKTGNDNLYFSGIGDETNWNFSGTDSDAQYVEIGYKDNGDIVGVVPLSKDFVIFKSNAVVYRLVGDYPNWSVYEVSRNALAVNKDCLKQVMNDVVFLDKAGLRSLSTVVEYGDIKQFELGAKVNPYLTPQVEKEIARIWHNYKKNQIWVRTNNSSQVWVYYYPFKAWTIFDFYTKIEDMTIKDNDIYIASGTKIFIFDDNATKDDDIFIVEGLIGTKRFVSKNNAFVISAYGFTATAYTNSNVTIQIDKASKNYDIFPQGDIAYSDSDIAALDTDAVVSPMYAMKKQRQTLRVKEFSFKFIINQGSIGLNSVFAFVKEV